MRKSISSFFISAFFISTALMLSAPAARAQDSEAATPQDQTARPKAIEYSEGYETRAKIHKIASYATLPLVGTEAFLGQSLYNDGGGAKKGAHIAVGTAITGLFAVNTVTGVWNLWEGRNDPHHRTLRILHGVLMLGADAGFAAAFATGPGGRSLFRLGEDDDRQMHRTIALTSLGVAAGGYLMMLIGDR
jgi:hypothetical protein